MKHTTTINGVVFEVKKAHRTNDDLSTIAFRRNKSLNDCYKSCSRAKTDIYCEWYRWSYDVKGLYYFGIGTYNAQMFTLTGIIEEQPITSNETGEILNSFKYGNDEMYLSDAVIRITPTHNYIEIVI